ncbi:hypothetical protein PG988_003646 [Apiospora saccharicola]
MPPTVIYANKPKDFSLWDAHKDLLKDLYLTQKRSLKEVKQLMETEHGFPNNLTVSAYETTLRDHFGFRKNLKRLDWEAVDTHLEKREGKESEVAFLGDRLTSKRVAKETGRYCPKARKRARNAGNPTPAVYGPPSSTLHIVPPTSVQANVEHLLKGNFGVVWTNLPFNEFTRRLLEILKSQTHLVTAEALQSLFHLHQMTGSPMVFGLNSSVGVLLHASHMLSNGHSLWTGKHPFLEWFDIVADMRLLQAFFSQRTPTVVETWCRLARASRYRLFLDSSLQTWFEIGRSILGGGDAASTKALIRKGLPIPRILKPEYRIGSPEDLNHRLECVKILVEAGVSIDAKADDHLHWKGPGEPDLLTDWLWLHRHQKAFEVCNRYSERFQTCVTVSGICAAAGEGLDRLSRYVQEKRTPSFQVTQELFQVALSEASEQSLEGIVETLLDCGVDIEYLIGKRSWMPQFTTDGGGPGTPLPFPHIKPIVELLAHIGVNVKQHGTETMLQAVGLLNHRDCSWRVNQRYLPDRDVIKALKELGVAWDQDYFNNRKQLSSWEGWDGRESGGMDLLQAAVRKGCHEDTVEYLLNEGMQVHSRPCKADGKTIVHAALENDNLSILKMLLARLTDVQSDPAWPRLLELSFCGYYTAAHAMEIFEYLRDLGATFPPITCHFEAERRLGLISKMLKAKAPHEIIQGVWRDVVGAAELNGEDFTSVLGDTICNEGFMWACKMIEQGIYLKDKDVLWLACQIPDCPLWFVRYLLGHGVNIKGSCQGNGRTALHYAAENGNLALSTLLMAYGANVNGIWKNRYGVPSCNVFACAEHGKYSCRTSHLARRSYTPLDLAAGEGRLDLVKLLLDCGGRSAIPGLTGFDGALDLAKEWCRGGVVMLLENWIHGIR